MREPISAIRPARDECRSAAQPRDASDGRASEGGRVQDRSPSEGTPGTGAEALIWLFGVLVPLGTLLIELATGFCAGELFDPLPTWLHAALVALVPAANATALVWLTRRPQTPPPWVWRLLAAGAGVALVYALVFLPLTPFALVAVIVFGLGLLPLAPLLGLVCAWYLGSRMKRRARSRAVPPPAGRWLAGLAPVLLLLAVAAPEVLTRHWLRLAIQGTPSEQTSAVKQLRRLGSDDVLLRAAYGQFGSPGIWFGRARPGTAAQAQEVYFRVTGRPFNAVPPPSSLTLLASRQARGDFEWDAALGGESVAGRVSGLSLVTSRLDASAHASEGWGYTEWTMEFRNDHPARAREARAILQLPPGGVVSRVTLWVNGEEREAAFAGRGATRAAYQKVAVAEQRDPILVTTAGPDRVLLQCFPVPPNGGVMKVRVGVTAPLTPLGELERAFLWPRMVERNFAAREEVRHQAWLEVLDGTPEAPPGWSRDGGRPNALRAAIADPDAEALRSVRLRATAPAGGWARDDRAMPAAWVRQRLETATVRSSGRLALVLDGGLGAETWLPAVRTALEQTSGGGSVGVWIAHDGSREVFRGEGLAAAAAALGRWREPFRGGHDPVPALEAALDWAGEAADGTVLWVRGPQPFAGPDGEALRQRLERGRAGLTLVEVAALDGPNRLAERLEGVAQCVTLARVDSLADDLGRFLHQWTGLSPSYRWTPERTEADPGAGVTASRHLVRLWAAEMVARLRAERRVDDAVALSAKWQLVTPVSGAVVLETQEQYERAGLQPVDPLTTPQVVPEPGAFGLLALGAAALWLLRRDGRRFERRHGEELLRREVAPP